MPRAKAPILAPDLRELLREARAPFEVAAFWLAPDRLAGLPRGDGHPVLFLPGFGMGDEALRPMARTIERLGYAVHGWDEGRNFGLRTAVAERLLVRVQDLHARHGQRVSLVGWSTGGLYARELARARPECVRRVISFGSPIRRHESGAALVSRARAAFEGLLATIGKASFEPSPDAPPVPCTAIHSRSDGVVAWRAALETDAPHMENLEVDGSHLALGYNLEVLRRVAERLAIDPARSRPRKR